MVPTIDVIAAGVSLPGTAAVVTRAGEHTGRETKESCDQQASSDAIEGFHGLSPNDLQDEQEPAGRPYRATLRSSRALRRRAAGDSCSSMSERRPVARSSSACPTID